MLKRYNSRESRQKRTKRAQRAANVRWARYHESLAEELPRVGQLEDLWRITVENITTGKETILLFHPGNRANNYRIEVDGKPWKTCGMTEAVNRIRSSLYSANK